MALSHEPAGRARRGPLPIIRCSQGTLRRFDMRPSLLALVLVLATASLPVVADDKGHADTNDCASTFVSDAQQLLVRHQVIIGSASTTTPTVLEALGQYDQGIRATIRQAAQTCALERSDRAMLLLMQIMHRIDGDNQTALRNILKETGWPSSSAWGSGAANAAFLIVQHADADPELQRRGISMLERLVAEGEAPPDEFALLFDRIRVSSSQPQRYGTQGTCQGHEWKPFPIEDAEQVDKRRATVGLPPLAQYANVATRLGCQR